jgi:competence protein ComGC
MQKFYSINQPVSSFVVGRNTPQGWLTVGHGTQQPANAVVLPLVVAPVAIMAGLTLPALAKAKGKAQSISCVNNLKQMGLAARIYATDHNDAYPPDLLSMKNELVTPKILVCPNDPNHAVTVALTWDNFDPSQSSYDYVTRGLTDATPGFEKKVLFRCRIHGHVCMGDGSVMQKNSGPGGN